jgi:polyprenyl-phospho-N-acetylgalactosaminyl synthase
MKKIDPEHLWFLIPAYNEGEKIREVVERIKKSGYPNILVVNDGSKDATESEALYGGAEVVSHLINRGQGAAYRTGFTYLKKRYSPEAIITFDADGRCSSFSSCSGYY